MNPHPKTSQLTPFQPGQSGNPKGRPKSRAKADLKAVFTPEEIAELKSTSPSEIREWDEYIIKMTVPQLQTIATAPSVAAYARAICIAILTDIKNGRTGTIDRLNERVNGKQARPIEITGAESLGLIPARILTKQEAAEIGLIP